MSKLESNKESLSGWRHQAAQTTRLRKIRRLTIMESALWVGLLVFSAIVGTWTSVPLILVILLKTYQVYTQQKLLTHQQSLLDDMIQLIKKLPVKKGKK